MNRVILFLLACFAVVSAIDESCYLPIARGICHAYFVSYGFNTTSRQCEEFVYGGCWGNDNRFDTQEECEEACLN